MWELLQMGLSTVSDVEYKQIKLYLFIHWLLLNIFVIITGELITVSVYNIFKKWYRQFFMIFPKIQLYAELIAY